MTETRESVQPKMTAGLVALLSVAAGLAVGNLYWAQPLLAEIAAEFGVEASACGLLVMATQVGYAVGMLLVVPLGDVLDRRRMIPGIMALSVAALLACSFAPAFAVLGMALALLGLTTVSGQVIVPLSGELAGPGERGRVVGTVGAGITGGILVARALSGLVAAAIGWRGVYVAAAVLNVAVATALYRALPEMPRRGKVSYGKLVADVFTAIGRYPAMPRIMAISGLSFGVAFNLFWNGVTFLLSAEPFSMTPFQIGLVSLAGVTGAVCSVWVGHFQDAGAGIPATGVFVAACAACMAAVIPAGASLAGVVLTAAVYSFAVQGVSVLNQARLLSLSPAEGSRLNTVFVVNNFVCAAVGSAASAMLWDAFGWPGVAGGATAACLTALAVWAASRKAIALPGERER